jgi:methyltransferase family protein
MAGKFLAALVGKLHAALLRATGLEASHHMRHEAPPAVDGWFRSFEERAPVDRQGEPIPWYTYPAIEFLRTRVRPEMTVFEYGCGNSTLWWAKRVAQVVSVEHDSDWHRRIATRVPPNVTLRHVPLERPGEYAGALVREGRRFDVVVIDGRERVECTRHVVDGLSEGGVIVFDNAERPDYAEGYAALEAQGFRRIDFVGMAPIVVDKITTSVFYRPDNCFRI